MENAFGLNSLDELNSADTGEMTVILNGRATDWRWTFAGPGHERTIEINNKMARDRLHRERLIEQAQVNGKKYKAPEEGVEDIKARNVDTVVARLLGWTPVTIGGQPLEFSPERARELLLDPKKINLLVQALEFLSDEASFTQRSGSN